MYQKTILDNGVRIVSERLPDAYSVTVGVWLQVGSRDEAPPLGGASHFIEHMAFKGTARRDPLQIAQEIDRLGGMANAFTSKEHTCFHARALTENMPQICDLLLDLVLSPAYDPTELERERQVILQEISAMEDAPDDLVHVLFGQSYWSGHPLGRPILGTAQSVANLDRQTLLGYLRASYRPQGLVVAAVGNLEHERLVDLVSGPLSKLEPVKGMAKRTAPRPNPELVIKSKDLEQVHVAFGMPAPSAEHPGRFAAAVVNLLLGGNMSSRLFQEVRERRGLAYSIYSYLTSYSDAGMMGIYMGVAPERALEAVSVVREEVAKLAKGPISKQELDDAKQNLRGSILLSTENPESRMSRLARNELLFKRFVPIDEVLEKIEAVDMAKAVGTAKEILGCGPGATILGPLGEDAAMRELGW